MMWRLSFAWGMHVDDVAERMDSRLRLEAMAIDALDGIPDAWQQTGGICATISNAMGVTRKDGQSWTADHFTPGQQPKRVMTGDDAAKVERAVS